MKKKRVFSLLSMIVAMFMIVIQLTSINVQAADSKEVSPITVTFNSELVDGTLALPQKLTVSYSKFSDFGLNITNDDPGVITPLHVLAAYYMQVKHATKDNITNYIDVAEGGYINKVEGYEGAKDPEDKSDYWMFAVNNKFPAGEDGYGYAAAAAPLSDGDKVTFFGIDYPQTQYYSTFTSDEYKTGANVAVSVALKTLNLSDYNTSASTKYDITGANLKAYKLNEDGSLSELQKNTDYEITTEVNRYGNAGVLFKNQGTYYLSAEKIDSDTNYNTISRPITKVVVSGEEEYKIDKDMDNLSLYNTTIYGPTAFSNTAKGRYYGTPITWNSEDESVLKIVPYSDSMVQFVPQDLHQDGDKTVKVKAKMALGSEVREKEFDIKIIGSLFLKSLKIDGIDKTIDTLNEYSLVAPLTDDIKELTLTPTLEGTNENLVITVNGNEVKSGESYKYTVDNTVFSNTINVKVSRSDVTNATHTYTIILCKSASKLPSYDAFWGSAKQDNTNNSTVNAYTPRSTDEIDNDASWNVNLREGKGGLGKWSYPIVVNKNIYIAADTTLYKYDLNGNLLAQGELTSTVLGAGYTGWLAYGDGMIFVPLGGGSVEAFNADDLTPLWRSNSMSSAYGQSSSPLIYNNGYLYTGATNGSNAGVYGCIKTSDDDKTSGYETKNPVWVFNDNDTNPSFYWAGAVIAGNSLIVPCDTGKVYSINMSESIKSGNAVVTDTYTANDKIRTSICYDKDSESIYFPTGSNGTLYKIKVDESTGKFGEAKTAELGGQSNCAPVIYKDRLYVSAPTGIYVFNKNTLEQIYLAEATDMGKGNQNIRHLSLSTAYAKESNNYEVYIYGYDYATPGYVSLLKDNQKATDGTVELIHENTESPQYSTSNIVIADDGSLLYVNDSNHLFCLKSSAKEESDKDVSVTYSSQIQNIGWQNEVSDGAISGTSGKSLRLEGMKIKVNGDSDLGVSYSAQVQNIGWQNSVKDGELAGTSSKSLRLEAIKINLTGTNASKYDIYYRVHVQDKGWLGWAKNGSVSGTVGLSKRVEAIEIKIVKQGEAAPGSTDNSCIYKEPKVNYKSHLQNIGWQGAVSNGAVSGTIGQSRRMEAMNVSVSSDEFTGGIKYRSHVQNIGWQKEASNGELTGTSGKGYRLEAVQFVLTGELAKHYDVYYRVHAQNFGWMNWAKNGEAAGTAGYGYRLEAVQVMLVKKGDKAPEGTGDSYKAKDGKTVENLE